MEREVQRCNRRSSRLTKFCDCSSVDKSNRLLPGLSGVRIPPVTPPLRAYSSIGQSSELIIRWLQVRDLLGPPPLHDEIYFYDAAGREVLKTAKETGAYKPKYSVYLSVSGEGRNDEVFAEEIKQYLRIVE